MAETNNKSSLKEKFKGSVKKLRHNSTPFAAKKNLVEARAKVKLFEKRLSSLDNEYKNAVAEARQNSSSNDFDKKVDRVLDFIFGSKADQIQDEIKQTQKEHEEAVAEKKRIENQIKDSKNQNSSDDEANKEPKKKTKNKKKENRFKKAFKQGKKILGKTIYYAGKGISTGAKALSAVVKGMRAAAKGLRIVGKAAMNAAKIAMQGANACIQAGNACVAATAHTLGLSLVGAAACYAAAAGCVAAATASAAVALASYTAAGAMTLSANALSAVSKTMDRVGQAMQRQGNNMYKSVTNQNISGYSPQNVNTNANSISQNMAMEKPSMEKPSLDKNDNAKSSQNSFSDPTHTNSSANTENGGNTLSSMATTALNLYALSGRTNSQHRENIPQNTTQQVNNEVNSPAPAEQNTGNTPDSTDLSNHAKIVALSGMGNSAKGKRVIGRFKRKALRAYLEFRNQPNIRRLLPRHRRAKQVTLDPQTLAASRGGRSAG